MNRTILLCLSLLVVALPALAADEAPEKWYLDLTFDEALAKAKAENKLVFVDFYATWCAPCKIMDETTYKDPRVIKWLREKTIPIKVDAEKNVVLSGQYNINSFPTLLFVKADGTEVDRLLGLVTSEQLLSEGKGIIRGKDAITRALEEVQADPKDPQARLALATTYARKQRFAEALAEFAWCLDYNLSDDPKVVAPVIGRAVNELLMMGQVYPKAIGEIMTRRDQARERLLAGKGTVRDALILAIVNESFGNLDDTLKVFDEVRDKAEEGKVKEVLTRSVIGPLLDARRYKTIAEEIDILQAVNEEFEAHSEARKDLQKQLPESAPSEQRKMMTEHLRTMLIMSVSGYYQALIGLDRNEDAAKIANRLLDVAGKNAQTYNALAWSGYLTGEPTEENIEQARKAYALAKVEDGSKVFVLDTLARVLYAAGQKEDALRLAEEGRKLARDPQERDMILRLLDDLKK